MSITLSIKGKFNNIANSLHKDISVDIAIQNILKGDYKKYSGGDVSLGPDGTFYFTAYNNTVFYKGVFNGNKIETSLITTSLPTASTSGTIGSDGYLYYATNNTPSKIYKVDLQSGAATLLYTLSAYKANDFGILLKDEEQQEDDTDGDGVPDDEDDYPEDREKMIR